jgi:SAM-dependent methyltransferase
VLLYQQRFEAFAAGSITNAYNVVACQECGMCFASGLPDAARFSEYYAQSSKYDLGAKGAEVSSFDAKRYEDEAAFIAAHVSDRAGSVLDIGTATGDLLVALRGQGFTNLHGVEPSPDAARQARDRHGLDVIVGDVRDAKSLDMRFSVVSLVAVLEHLVDPQTSVRELADLLEPDGVLYFLVPDAGRFADHLDAPYQEFSVEHINFFTSGSLGNLMASVGLEVLAEQASLVKLSPDADGPALEVIVRRKGQTASLLYDSDGGDALRRYVAVSSEKEAGIAHRIAELAEDRSPIYVWGTGTNALHLLAASRLSECNIVSFLDSNPHYSGQQLAGRSVTVPEDVATLQGPILVASAISQTAIVNAARTLFGPDVPLILLY